MSKKYKHLLFDADNTLFDFNAAEKSAFLALREIDHAVFNEESYPLYHRINDNLWKRLEKCEVTKNELKRLRFRELYEALSIPATGEIIEKIVETYPKNLAKGTALIDGAPELITYLYGKYGIYIITNGLYDVQTARFKNSELNAYISELFISEQIGAEKPSVKFFNHVIDAIGDKCRENYLVIGDSLSSDIDGAIASGIDCVYFDRGNTGTNGRNVTKIIRKLEELKEML